MKSKTRTRRNWASIIDEWSQSGLTVAEYCKVHGLAPSGFYKARRQRTRSTPAAKHPPAFLDVMPALAAERSETSNVANPTLRIRTKSGCIVEVFV